jgi:transketolase
MIREAQVLELKKIALQLRRDVVEMVGIGRPGHLGGACSLADIVATLYFHTMRINGKDPKDPERDRFLLSKGHVTLIQYAALAELGYFPRSDFKDIKAIGCHLQGHPDLKTPGIEAVTGSLGQGLSIGLGMALTFRLDERPNRVFVAMGDGELSEGQLWEAAMAARKFAVDNLVGIIDCNKIQASGPTCEIFDIPDIPKKWEAFGWHVIRIDGHDIREIAAAFEEAETIKGRPTAIVANTVKGKGISFAENNPAFHNGVLTEELYRKAMADLDALGAEFRKPVRT